MLKEGFALLILSRFYAKFILATDTAYKIMIYMIHYV